jgi:hypothetical protein
VNAIVAFSCCEEILMLSNPITVSFDKFVPCFQYWVLKSLFILLVNWNVLSLSYLLDP